MSGLYLCIRVVITLFQRGVGIGIGVAKMIAIVTHDDHVTSHHVPRSGFDNPVDCVVVFEKRVTNTISSITGKKNGNDKEKVKRA